MAVTTQDLTAQIYTGSWQDISTYIYQRDTVQAQIGRQNEASTLQPCSATMTLNNRDARFTTRNPAGAYYPNLVQNTPLRLSVPVADAGLTNYLRLETDRASYASCPDSAGLQITSGTLSVRWDGVITDWSQSLSDGTGAVLMAKYGATAQAWALWTNSDGTIKFEHFDGSVTHSIPSTVPVPYYGQRIALRVDYAITPQTVTFFWAPTMGGSWTQLGAATTTTATAQGAGTGQPVTVGGGPAIFGIAGMYGSVYEAQVLATGVLKADPVFSSQTAGVTSFSDSQSNTWTLNGTAELSGRLYRFHGEMSSVPKAADPSGRDIYSQATAYGVTQRLQNSNTPLNSPMYRAYVRLPSTLNLAAYWPCEDGTNATTIGSAVGGPPMQISAGPSGAAELASNSDFACSSPIPVMNSGTFTGTVPAGTSFTDASVRLLLSVPAGGETNGAGFLRVFYTGGSAAYGTLVYTTGGFLTWTVYAYGGSVINSTGAQLMGPGGTSIDGVPVRVACDILNAGSSITVQMGVIAVGQTTAIVSFGTVASSTVGTVTQVLVSGISAAVGHVSVQGVSDTLFDVAGPLDAWSGETAGARVARLCAEEGINCRIVGPPAVSMPMGNQAIDTLYNILQECENTDLGQLFEPRQALAIGYRTRASMYHQAPAATVSYSSAQLFQGFGSTGDTQLVVNDVTAQAPDGSIARQQLLTGAMSVQAPPNGIGRIDTQIQPNPADDSQLNQIASWYLSVRSVDDDRYPAIPFVLNRTETPPAVLALNVGDLLQVTGTPAWLPPPPVSQLCAGFTETWFPGPYWSLAVNGIPALPYATAQFDTARFDTAGSALSAGITTTATSFTVVITGTGPRWTTSAGSFPFGITVGREEMTVTNITGSSSPQTFTVTRSVNGVVLAHAGGTPVALYNQPLFAL